MRKSRGATPLKFCTRQDSTSAPIQSTVCNAKFAGTSVSYHPKTDEEISSRRLEMYVRQMHAHFAGEVTGIDLRQARDAESIDKIHDANGQYGILVFRNQSLDSDKTL